MTDTRLNQFYAEPNIGNYKGFFIKKQKRDRMDGSWSLILTNKEKDVTATGVSKGEALVNAFEQIDQFVEEDEKETIKTEQTDDEIRFGNLVAEYLYKKNLLSELEEKKEGTYEPEMPKGPISYKEAKEIKESEQNFVLNMEDLEKKISELTPEIEELKNQIKSDIPLPNTEIRITGTYKGKGYQVIIEHLQGDDVDRLEVSEE